MIEMEQFENLEIIFSEMLLKFASKHDKVAYLVRLIINEMRKWRIFVVVAVVFFGPKSGSLVWAF